MHEVDRDCIGPILLQARWVACPDELDDRIVDNLIEGLAAMATAGS